MKKIMTIIAAAAAAFTLMGCVVDEEGVNWNSYTKDKQNKIAVYAQIKEGYKLTGSWYIPDTVFFAADDSEGVIKGSNDNYTVEYDNTEGTAKYRAYKETALKHAGALIKVKFDDTNTGASKMGVIFDLKNSAAVNGGKDFYAIAIGQEGGGSYYVSKFTNITNIQDENFGATTTATGTDPKEIEIVKLATGNLKDKMPAKATDGSQSFYVYYKLMSDGSFNWAILDMTDEEMKKFKGNQEFNDQNLDDYKVLVKGNTKDKAGAEYDAAETK